jgi:hypothetical protein
VYNFLYTYPYAELEARKFFKANRNEFYNMVDVLDKQYLAINNKSKEYINFSISDDSCMMYLVSDDPWFMTEEAIKCILDEESRKAISKFINTVCKNYFPFFGIVMNDDYIRFDFSQGWNAYYFLRSNQNEKDVLSNEVAPLFKVFHIYRKWYYSRERNLFEF